VTTINDVKAAYAKIEEAEVNYRATLRQALADGVIQADLMRALERNRETLRQDAMPEEERTALRTKELERQRARREAAKTGGRK
jgi:hypothetical protein